MFENKESLKVLQRDFVFVDIKTEVLSINDVITVKVLIESFTL